LFGIEEEMVPSGGEVNELDVQIYRFADMMSKV
jgi:hypothetical protein